MADVHSSSVRSKNMRAIRHRDTKPELFVRKALHAKGFRYRVNVKTLAGTPDVALPKHRAVIFIHGCFWHGHGCHLFKLPKTNTKFWQNKIENNFKRDIISQGNLMEEGWKIAVVWECALKGPSRLSTDTLIDQLSDWITSSQIQTIEFLGIAIEGVPHT